MSTFANSEDPNEMQHNCCISLGSTLFVKVQNIFRMQYFLKIITLDP